LNGLAIMLPYVMFSGNVRWDKTRKDYLVWIGFAIGCLLLWEIFWIYHTGNVIEDGVINRRAIFTGWGMYNNIGSTLAMTIPFPFYLAAKYRQGWLGTLTGSVFLVGVLLTCSRTSIFCGCAIYFVCVLLMLSYAKDWKANTFTLIFFTGAAIAALYFFGDQIKELFSALLDKGLDSSDRDEIYAEGIKLFSKYPILGGSFFSPDYMPWAWATNASFTSVFPPRWHNTYVQLLASCGIVGLATYAIHRWQTVKLFVKNRTPEKAFTACSIIVLLTTSLFDCHFFNVGPVLFYSMALAFAENIKE
jgi:O-antigen ligase